MIVLLAILIPALAGALLIALRRHRTPQALRGDWWPRFESEFWSYVQTNAAQRARQRSRRDRNHPQAQ